MIRKTLLGFALLLVLVVALYLRYRHVTPPLEIAYAGSRTVTLWSTSAQVREPVTTVSFGNRLDVLQRFQDQVKVRTTDGTVGWIEERDLLSADLWQTLRDLEAKSATMPVEARGHTRVLTNLHLEPGRDAPRVRQLNKDIPLELLTREPMAIASSSDASAEAESAGEPAPEKAGREAQKSELKSEVKKEDWWFVRAHTPDQGVLAGWLLGRFVELDVPSPLPDYASSAEMRIVAWMELDRVASTSGKPMAQYLLVGAHGPEGQACDFTSIRVYTWGKQKARYETAFVENNVCGKLPIVKTKSAGAEGDIMFSFQDLSGAAPEKRVYQMHQTIVRLVKEGGEPVPRKHRR
ncbi:MAG: SH3 domain-containing protein [Candidatus Acidiferrales bacterium]